MDPAHSKITSVQDRSLFSSVEEISGGTFKNWEKMRPLCDGMLILSGWVIKEDESIVGAVIPNGIRGIAGGTFENCCGLRRVQLPRTVKYINREAFSGCTDVQNGIWCVDQWGVGADDELTSASIPHGIRGIAASAFDQCYDLAHVDLPDTLNHIGDYAFGTCAMLKNVDIPDSVKRVGIYVFYEGSS